VLTTRDLALYAAIIGTLGGVWSLYLGLVLDRARILVTVAEGEVIDAVTNERTPVVMVRLANRGRRPAHIANVSRVVNARTGRLEMSADIAGQVPLRLEEGQGQTVVHGARGGYAAGTMPLTRWFVSDGSGRVSPLRERYRQRIERLVRFVLRHG